MLLPLPRVSPGGSSGVCPGDRLQPGRTLRSMKGCGSATGDGPRVPSSSTACSPSTCTPPDWSPMRADPRENHACVPTSRTRPDRVRVVWAFLPGRAGRDGGGSPGRGGGHARGRRRGARPRLWRAGARLRRRADRPRRRADRPRRHATVEPPRAGPEGDRRRQARPVREAPRPERKPRACASR